ncbi:hypothetical protein NM208_g14730 [Fusarium decemcellulare]|uniref:Uncharacterized protein n=1 Tax=Fusarium decemcellulare TaxID=57161 RepID=A0ACC1RF39_9HYPO|nr:hypothetical protein NM208_g14730 [Fusarium decemcellulare]
MDGQTPITNLGLACPYGGNFYICRDSPTQFIGCCKSDPCGERKGLCPDEHLRSASFEAKQYNQMLPQACINDNRDVKWYTCAGTTPSFLGCCAVNPCAKGACPARELRAAKLSDNSKNAEPFRGGGPPPDPVSSSSTSSSSSSTSSIESSQTISSFTTSYLTTTTTDTTITATNTSEAGTDAPGGHKKLDDGAIAAIAIGTIIFILVIFGLLYCARRERKRERQDIKDLWNQQENASIEKNISRGKTDEQASDNNSDKLFIAEMEQPPNRRPSVCNPGENEAARETHHPQQRRHQPQGHGTQNGSPSPPTPFPQRQAHDGDSLVSKPSDWSLNCGGPEALLDRLSAHSPHPHGSRDLSPSQSPSPQPATALLANNWFQTKSLGNTGRQNRGNSPFAPDPDTQSRGNTPPTILSHFGHNIRKQNRASPGVSGKHSREKYASTATGASGATVPFVLQEHMPVAGTLPA